MAPAYLVLCGTADVGLVSSSLDATLAVLDLERGKLSATVVLHRKGVRTFGYSPAFSLVARWVGCLGSAGLWQRWQPATDSTT